MDFYILIYRVTIDNTDTYNGKAALVIKNEGFNDELDELKKLVLTGYREKFPFGQKFRVDVIKKTQVTFAKYLAFVNIASEANN